MYNSCLHYSFNKLETIASIYKPKAFFDLIKNLCPDKAFEKKSAYNPFLFWPLPQLLLLLSDLSDCIDKFCTYYPHYKDKVIVNLTRTFGCATNCLYFLLAKKGKPPRTSLYLLSTALQLPSLMFSSMFSKMRPAMFKYLAMFKYATMIKWHLAQVLLAFPR